MTQFSEKVRERKIIERSLIYLGAAWVALEVTQFLTQNYGLSRKFLDVGLLVLGLGFLAHLVIAWHHGVKGTQTAGRKEIGVLGVLAAVALGGSAALLSRDIAPDRNLTVLPAGAEDLGAGSVAVLPFANNSGADSLRWLGAGIADMLTTNLAQFSALRVVSAQRLLDLLRQAGSDETDHIPDALAQQITASSGAHMYVVGQIAVVGDEYRIDARLIGVEDGTVMAAETARGEDLFGLIDTVGVRLSRRAAGAGAVQPTELASVADMATGDLDAYREYREGVRAERRFLQAEAIEHYQRAIDIDSTFALAAFRLGTMYAQTGSFGNTGALFAQAHRHLGSASERDRLLIEGPTTLFQGDPEEAMTILRELVSKYPEDKDGRFWLAQVYATQGMIDERVQLLEEMVQLDPFYGPAFNELAYVAARVGDFARADSLISRYAEIEPEQPNPWDSKGEILEMAEDLEGARTAFRKAIEVDPSFFRSYDHLIRTYLSQGDAPGARGELVELVGAKDPAGAVEAQILVGDTYTADAQFLEALRYYQMAAETAARADRPDLVTRALGEVGATALVTGQYEVAGEATAAMRDIDAAAYDAFFLSLVVAGQQGRLDEARQSRDQVAQGIAQLPPQVQHLANFVIPVADGVIAFYEQDYEGTVRLTAEARALNDGVSPSVLEIEALIELGRTDEALEALDASEKRQQAARHGDRFNRIRTYVVPYYRGRAYEEAGDAEAAIAAYQATIDMAGGGLREFVVIRDAPDRIAALEAAK